MRQVVRGRGSGPGPGAMMFGGFDRKKLLKSQ